MKYKIEAVIKLTDGKIRLPEEYQPALKNLIAFADKNRGGYVKVILSPPHRARTTGEKSQNHCINGYIGQIANHTGHDEIEIKIHVKRQAFKRGYPKMLDNDGNIVYSLLDGEPWPASETTIDTTEAGYLIDELEQLAAELDIKLRKV